MTSFFALTSDVAAQSVLQEQMQEQAGDGTFFADSETLIKAWEKLSDKDKPKILIVDEVFLAGRDDPLRLKFIGKKERRPFFLVLGDLAPLEAFTCLEENAVQMHRFAKPIRLGHLLSQINFHLKVHDKKYPQSYLLKNFSFDPSKGILVPIKGGQGITLTEKETALLTYLCRAEESIPKHILLEEIWGYDSDVDTHTLETHIYRLRRKMTPEGRDKEEDVFLVDGGSYQLNPSWIGS